MAAASDYITGTISLTNGEVEFTGAGTGWLLAQFKEGDTIIDITGATEFMGVIATIDGNGAGTLTKAWEGPTLTNVAYRMRYQPDGARVSAQARNLIELLGDGNLQAVAGLSGSANQVIMFTGPGTMTTVPKSDLVSGADYDVQVADEAALAAYDGQSTGFAVLVSDDGAGRAYIVSKLSNSAADWSDPAYVTGPTGPLPVITVGTVTTGAPGTDVEVVGTPTVDGVELDFTIPAGEGFLSRGDYAGGTAYAKGDVVQQSGSSWIAKQATTGNAPPTIPTTSNAYWQLLARRGIDGAGTVNAIVAGAGIAVDNTDPTAPVVSVTNVEPVGYGDLLVTVSLLALQVADNTTAALFLGRGGNVVVDSFRALTYVDVAGGTNLDTGTAGVLRPTTGSPTMIAQATGSIVTDFTTRTTAQNDGVTNQAGGASAAKGGSPTTGYSGKNFSAAPKRITSAMVYGGNDTGFVVNTNPNITIQLRASNSAPNSDGSNGTLLGSVNFNDTGNESAGRSIVSNDQITAWNYVWVRINKGSDTEALYLAELQFYEPGLPANMTVPSVAFAALVAPTKMKALLRVKEVDAAVAGTDYTLECSRDGGTTWSIMTLTELFTAPSPTANIRVVEAAETSVSGQPSGTAPRWRFKTLNNKMVELHDLYFYWS